MFDRVEKFKWANSLGFICLLIRSRVVRNIHKFFIIGIMPWFLSCSKPNSTPEEFVFTTVDKVVEGNFGFGSEIKVHGFLTKTEGQKLLKLSTNRDYSHFNGLFNLDVFYPSAGVSQNCFDTYVVIDGTVIDFSGTYALDFVREISPLNNREPSCIKSIEEGSYYKKIL